MSSFARVRSAAVVAVAIALCAACAPNTSERSGSREGALDPNIDRGLAGDLLIVEDPDVSGASQQVREQVARGRAAVEELLASDDADPAELGEALGRLGLLFITYDFLAEAGVTFDQARRLMPEDYRWPYLMAYVRQIAGRPDEAAPLYQRALELNPGYQAARLRLGRALLETGDYAAARGWFEQALAADSDAVAAHEGLGRIASAQGDLETAIDELKQALELEPRATSLHYALGQAYRRLGDDQRARYHLGESGDVAVVVPDPLISPLAQLGEGAQFYLVQGGEALSDQHYEAASAAYRRALEQEPDNWIAHKGLSYSLEKQGDLEGAAAQLERFLRLSESSSDRAARAEALRVLGSLRALEGQDQRALDDFAASLQIDPSQPGVRLKLANAAARIGRFEEAVDQYSRLLESSRPEHASTFLVGRATALINLGRGAEAIADFERAVAASPDDPQVRLRFAEALDYLGEPKRAAAQRAAAGSRVESGSERVDLVAAEARQQLSRGEYAAAAASLERALELDPARSDVRHQLATVLGHLGRYPEALAQYRQVIEAEPRHAAARLGEITALILESRYGETRVRLQDALRLFPRDARLAHLQARLLATSPDAGVRDGKLGLEIARRLAEDRDDLRVRETLALAYAEAGQFDRAVELQRLLVAEVERSGDSGLATQLRSELAAFEARRAWVAASPDEILSATLGTPGA